MSTPNLQNVDNVGNFYMGFRSNLFAYDTRLAGGNIAPALRDLINLMEPGLAVSNTTTDLGFKLPQSFDTTAKPSSPYNGRFTGGGFSASNGTTANTDIFYQVPGGGSNLNLYQSGAWYIVVNSTSVSMFRSNISGNALNPSNYDFKQLGWVKNPLYNGANYPLNAYYLFLSSFTSSRGGGRPELPNNATRVSLRVPTSSALDSVANYSITCQTATPNANTTDLVLFDNLAPNRAIGVASNLLKTSLAIPVGQIYHNTGVDPDGSNNPFWLCVGEYGSERILMRVWTQNLT
jgi:hypothetical protein